MDGPTASQAGRARRDLEALEASGRGRIVPAHDEPAHRGRCAVCKLGPARVGELERAYVGFVTVPELARLYDLDERTIKRHAAFYSLGLFRAVSIRTGHARMIAAGLEKRDDITPDHAQRSLIELGNLSPPAGAGRADLADPAEPMSWERELRLTVRGRAGADTRPTVGAGSDGKGQAGVIDQAAPTDQADTAVPVRADWPEP